MLVVPSVTLCIFDERDRLLLLRHDDGDVWSTPGGAVEPADSPADAAIREAWEEMQLVVEPTQIIGVYGGAGFDRRYDNGDITTYVMTVFDCVVRDGVARPDGVEVHEARYVSEDESVALHVPDWLNLVLPDVFAWRRSGGWKPALFAAPTWNPNS